MRPMRVRVTLTVCGGRLAFRLGYSVTVEDANGRCMYDISTIWGLLHKIYTSALAPIELLVLILSHS